MENQIVIEGKSKTDRPFLIRYPGKQDAQEMCEYINKLSQERTYIRFQGEVISLEEEEKYLNSKLQQIEQHKSVDLLLIIDNKIHGICGVEMFDRTEDHVGLFGLSVDQSVRGEGLGEILMQTTLDEAKKHLHGLRIIKLEVKHPNTIAYQLYEKLGFKKYGHLPLGTKHQNEFVDEIFMYKEV
jgi:RimJ/RimL family protein N-acetyltransferase